MKSTKKNTACNEAALKVKTKRQQGNQTGNTAIFYHLNSKRKESLKKKKKTNIFDVKYYISLEITAARENLNEPFPSL